jgi:hypothetical protein
MNCGYFIPSGAGVAAWFESERYVSTSASVIPIRRRSVRRTWFSSIILLFADSNSRSAFRFSSCMCNKRPSSSSIHSFCRDGWTQCGLSWVRVDEVCLGYKLHGQCHVQMASTSRITFLFILKRFFALPVSQCNDGSLSRLMYNRHAYTYI